MVIFMPDPELQAVKSLAEAIGHPSQLSASHDTDLSGMCDPLDVTKLCIAQDPEADALLAADPLALLIGMLLDQDIQ
jgi:hypothetical protein